MMIFPWQKSEWQKLSKIKENNCLAHALLLIGPKGIGKNNFATTFIKKMLCLNNEIECHPRCHSCALMEGKTHPNVRWIEPEGASNTIKIEQIRQSLEFIHQTSLQDGKRFLLIDQAHRMNIYAANALLKMLEEPPSGVIFMLISDQWGRLPATVPSRCQRIIFPRPAKETSLNWLGQQFPQIEKAQLEHILAIAHHAPLIARQLLEEGVSKTRKDILNNLYILKNNPFDLLKRAQEWQNNDPIQFLDVVISWIMDLLYLQLGVQSYINNKDYEKELREIAAKSMLGDNVKMMNECNQTRNQLLAGINLNKQLLFENVLIRWTT